MLKIIWHDQSVNSFFPVKLRDSVAAVRGVCLWADDDTCAVSVRLFAPGGNMSCFWSMFMILSTINAFHICCPLFSENHRQTVMVLQIDLHLLRGHWDAIGNGIYFRHCHFSLEAKLLIKTNLDVLTKFELWEQPSIASLPSSLTSMGTKKGHGHKRGVRTASFISPDCLRTRLNSLASRRTRMLNHCCCGDIVT